MVICNSIQHMHCKCASEGCPHGKPHEHTDYCDSGGCAGGLIKDVCCIACKVIQPDEEDEK